MGPEQRIPPFVDGEHLDVAEPRSLGKAWRLLPPEREELEAAPRVPTPRALETAEQAACEGQPAGEREVSALA